jgi:hypothetical protein
MFSRSTKTGNVLSTIESQGFRKTRDFGLKLSETGVRSSGKCTSEPEGHFVPESCRKAEKRTAGRLCCNRHDLKAMGCRNGSRI